MGVIRTYMYPESECEHKLHKQILLIGQETRDTSSFIWREDFDRENQDNDLNDVFHARMTLPKASNLSGGLQSYPDSQKQTISFQDPSKSGAGLTD